MLGNGPGYHKTFVLKEIVSEWIIYSSPHRPPPGEGPVLSYFAIGFFRIFEILICYRILIIFLSSENFFPTLRLEEAARKIF